MTALSVRMFVTTVVVAATSYDTAWPATATPDSQAKTGTERGVAALGRLEPLGGIVRVAAPSTPDAGAVIARLLVERGTDVTAGQLLAEVDTTAVTKARVVQARADLETARRDATAAASLGDEACVLADVAERQFKRKSELLTKGAASKDETETAKGNAEAGAASCKARTSSARVAESRVASADAQLAERDAEFERTQVHAPFAGRVLDVLGRPGELARPDGIIELGRVEQMQAVAEVYEADIRFVALGQRARIHSEALVRDQEGTVTLIRPKVQKLNQIGDDPAARKDAKIVEVEIRLDDPKAVSNLTNLQVEIQIGR